MDTGAMGTALNGILKDQRLELFFKIRYNDKL